MADVYSVQLEWMQLLCRLTANVYKVDVCFLYFKWSHYTRCKSMNWMQLLINGKRLQSENCVFSKSKYVILL